MAEVAQRVEEADEQRQPDEPAPVAAEPHDHEAGTDGCVCDAAIAPEPYRDSLDAQGVAYEWIDASEIRRRWPAFDRGTVVADDVCGITSDETGIVPAGPGTALLQRMAVQHGARLFELTHERKSLEAWFLEVMGEDQRPG